jgi:hypothetical protein
VVEQMKKREEKDSEFQKVLLMTKGKLAKRQKLT